MLTRFMVAGWITLIFAGKTIPCPAQTAARWQDSSARKVILGFRQSKLDMVGFLRQEEAPVSRRVLDEVADSIVRIAASSSPGNETLQTRSSLAIQALVEAGARTQRGGTRYEGALDRLVRVDKISADPSTRREIAMNILRVGAFDRAVEFMIQKATSKDYEVAWVAMSELTAYLNPKALSYREATVVERAIVGTALQKIWKAVIEAEDLGVAAVPHEMARRILAQTAQQQQWSLRSRSGG